MLVELPAEVIWTACQEAKEAPGTHIEDIDLDNDDHKVFLGYWVLKLEEASALCIEHGGEVLLDIDEFNFLKPFIKEVE